VCFNAQIACTYLSLSNSTASHSWVLLCHSSKPGTAHNHTSCNSTLFTFGTHNYALFLYLASAQNVLIKVSSFESVNCWYDSLTHSATQQDPAAP
jgi:hypothetical protein